MKLSGQTKFLLFYTKERVGCNEAVISEDQAGSKWYQSKAIYLRVSFTLNFLTIWNII
jgi:hypothetical protein